MQTVNLDHELVGRVYAFLTNGGTYVEAAGLRQAITQALQAPAREAELRERAIKEYVEAEATTDKAAKTG